MKDFQILKDLIVKGITTALIKLCRRLTKSQKYFKANRSFFDAYRLLLEIDTVEDMSL
jgi:hypothetical protein